MADILSRLPGKTTNELPSKSENYLLTHEAIENLLDVDMIVKFQKSDPYCKTIKKYINVETKIPHKIRNNALKTSEFIKTNDGVICLRMFIRKNVNSAW